jgi:glycosyltransferase involved in cell wall biosynthesis
MHAMNTPHGARELDIAVILPAFNEELTVGKTIDDFHRELPTAAIYVIDNRSTDQTAAVSRAAIEKLKCAGGVIPEPRQGKGNALRRALTDVDADVYVMADADTTYPAADVHVLLAPIVAGEADIVVGDRISGGHYSRENERPLHNLGNSIIKWTVNVLFSASLSDITSGYRVMSRRFAKTYPLLVSGFEVETDMSMHTLHHRLRMLEFPVDYVDRPDGSVSKLRTVSDGARVFFTIAQIMRFYRPLAFFGSVAMVLLVAGFASATPAIQDWLRFRYVYHLPLAVLAVGLCITAIICFAVGLVLDSVTRYERLAFEQRWLDFERLDRNTVPERRPAPSPPADGD